MPYIKQEARLKYDIDEAPANAGELNYLISSICDEYLCEHGLKYANINEVIGVLECAKMEMYRRVAAPYEDTKIKENGDVYNILIELDDEPLDGRWRQFDREEPSYRESGKSMFGFEDLGTKNKSSSNFPGRPLDWDGPEGPPMARSISDDPDIGWYKKGVSKFPEMEWNLDDIKKHCA